MRAKAPHFGLARVKELVAGADFTVQEGRARVFHGTFLEARDRVQEVCAVLAERNFAHSVQLTWNVADVYGVRYFGRGWYLKLTIDDEEPEVAIVSFHPLQHPLRTNAGQVKP